MSLLPQDTFKTMPSTFSPIVLNGLTAVVTGGPGGSLEPPIGVYRSGPQIERFMLECNLDFRVNGSRLPSLLNFLRTVSEQEGGRESLVRVIEHVCDARHYAGQLGKHEAVVAHLNLMLRPEGYEVAERSGRWVVQQLGGTLHAVGLMAAKATTLDFNTVHRDVERALASAEDDPEDAITAACSMVESVCRSILAELQLELPARRDIDTLMRAVQEPLGLKPGRADLPAEIADDARKILSGLSSAVQGLGALRSHAGDAHGRERNFVRVDARMARLALNSASSLALFLIETWERKYRRSLPRSG